MYLMFLHTWFERMIIQIQKTSLQIRLFPTIVCYVFLWIHLWYFIIREHRTEWDAFLLGVFVYGVYELTNYATIKHWSPLLVLLDTCWGGILFAFVTHMVYLVSRYRYKI
jgi:uncharacterized membrane protein